MKARGFYIVYDLASKAWGFHCPDLMLQRTPLPTGSEPPLTSHSQEQSCSTGRNRVFLGWNRTEPSISFQVWDHDEYPLQSVRSSARGAFVSGRLHGGWGQTFTGRVLYHPRRSLFYRLAYSHPMLTVLPGCPCFRKGRVSEALSPLLRIATESQPNQQYHKSLQRQLPGSTLD